jgi:hypothetical protein
MLFKVDSKKLEDFMDNISCNLSENNKEKLENYGIIERISSNLSESSPLLTKQ